MKRKLLVATAALVAVRIVVRQARDRRWARSNVVHLFVDPPDYGTDDDGDGGDESNRNLSHGYVPGFPAH